MTKHSLRPIAICLMLANGLPLLAQQPAAPAVQTPSVLPGTTQGAFSAIEGRALDANGNALPNVTVRLRDVRNGKVVDSKLSDETGAFSFRGVDPGNYVVELVGDSDKVLAASRMVTVNSGEAISTIVKLPTQVRSLAGFLGAHAPVAAIIIGSAAAAGVLAVQSGDCVSPPCQ